MEYLNRVFLHLHDRITHKRLKMKKNKCLLDALDSILTALLVSFVKLSFLLQTLPALFDLFRISVIFSLKKSAEILSIS